MDKKEVTFGGITATIKRLKVRDRLIRMAIYQKLLTGVDKTLTDAAFEYAQVCTYITDLNGLGEWQPTTEETPTSEAITQFMAWLDLPIEIGDWLVGQTIYGIDTPKKAD